MRLGLLANGVARRIASGLSHPGGRLQPHISSCQCMYTPTPTHISKNIRHHTHHTCSQEELAAREAEWREQEARAKEEQRLREQEAATGLSEGTFSIMKG